MSTSDPSATPGPPLPPHDAPVTTPAQARATFADFARGFPELTLYRGISAGIAQDDEVAAIVLAARPGQARPILLLAALHDLVLRRPDLPAARWYPSVTGRPVPDGDPWPDVRAAALEHAEELRHVVATRATQTNEVNRAVHLLPLLSQATADLPDVPVVLVEMGASAGLLLGLDRYRVELTSPGGDAVVLGDPASSVRCAGALRDGAPVKARPLPQVLARVGLDLNPLTLDHDDEVRWLEACLWPDVVGRLERFRAAVALMRSDPPARVRGDMVDDLGATIAGALAEVGTTAGEATVTPGSGGVHVVVFSSWALTYVDRERRPDVTGTLAAVAAGGGPVSWLTAEPPGCVPGIPVPGGLDGPGGAAGATVLGVRRWRAGHELAPEAWGVAHPHGEWLEWIGPTEQRADRSD